MAIQRVSQLKKSDVKRFYNMLADEKGVKGVYDRQYSYGVTSVLDTWLDDAYLRNNPSDNVLKEVKQAHNFDTEKRKALTVAEQELFWIF